MFYYLQITFTQITFFSSLRFALFAYALFVQTKNIRAKTVVDFYVPAGAIKAGKLFETLAMDFNEEFRERDLKVNVHISNHPKNILEGAMVQSKTGILVLPIAATVSLQNTAQVVSLEPHLEKCIQGRNRFLNQLVPDALEASSPEGDNAIYSLPLYRNTPLMYYNLEMLAPIGVNADNLPKTWTDFEQLLQRYQKYNASVQPFFMGADWQMWVMESMALQYGIDPEALSITNPVAEPIVNYWTNLAKKGLVVTNENWTTTLNSFKNEIYPIICFESGGLNFLNQSAMSNIAVTSLPQEGGSGVHYGGYNILFSTNMTNEQQELAWLFVEFLYRPRVQAQMAIETGNLPVVKAAKQEANYQKAIRHKPFFNVAEKSAEQAIPFFMSPEYVQTSTTFKYDIRQQLMQHARAGLLEVE